MREGAEVGRVAAAVARLRAEVAAAGLPPERIELTPDEYRERRARCAAPPPPPWVSPVPQAFGTPVVIVPAVEDVRAAQAFEYHGVPVTADELARERARRG